MSEQAPEVIEFDTVRDYQNYKEWCEDVGHYPEDENVTVWIKEWGQCPTGEKK